MMQGWKFTLCGVILSFPSAGLFAAAEVWDRDLYPFGTIAGIAALILIIYGMRVAWREQPRP